MYFERNEKAVIRRLVIVMFISASLTSASLVGPVVHAAVTDMPNQKYASRSLTESSVPASQKLWAFNYTTCATSNDVVRCWGSGRNPVFGLPTSEMVSNYSTPIIIGPSLAGLTDLDAYVSEACGVSNGSVKCWGDSSNGVAGNGERGFVRSPLGVNGLASGVSSVVVNNVHACAVQNGSLICWGLLNPFKNFTWTTVPSVVPGLESGVELIVGTSGSHNCIIVNGGAKCVGSNLSGQLGDGSKRTSNEKFVDVVSLAAGSGVTTLDASSSTTCAIANAGAKCWGRGSRGQLGNSDTKDSSIPVNVSGLGPGSGATDISTGPGHTCAIVNSGVQCWGDNTFGQLGNGTTASSSVPVQVLGIGPGSGATDVAVGSSHTCAIVRFEVFCWGSSGNLGDGSGKSSTRPIGVFGLSNSAGTSVTTSVPKVVTPSNAPRTCLPNEMYLKGYSYRGFESERNSKAINWTFRYRPEDDEVGITRWEIIPLHPRSGKSKSGDLAFMFGNGCERLSSKESALYNPGSVREVGIERYGNGIVKQWSFNGTIPNVRDEVDRVALVGFNELGQRVAFHVRGLLQGPRRGGTIMGKIEYLKCRISVIGLPIAQGTYVVTHKTIQALDMAEVPYADKGNLVLEGFAIYQGVNSAGQVTGQVGFGFDGKEVDKDKLLRWSELAVNTAFDKVADRNRELAGDNPKTFKDKLGDPKFTIEVKMYLEDWMAALDAIGETVRTSSSDVCKFWS